MSHTFRHPGSYVEQSKNMGNMGVEPQVPQAQDNRRRTQPLLQACCVLQGSRFIEFVWEIHFRYQNAKIKL